MDDKELNKIANGIEYLIHRQNRNGSFGKQSDLDIDCFTTTCHVLTLLIDIGYNPEAKIIKKAIDFIAVFESEGPIVSYWRLEPFARLYSYPSYKDRLSKIIENDLNIVYKIIQIGAGSPKPHTISLPLFGLKILNILNRNNKEWEELFIRHALQQWDIDYNRLWGVPDTNSMAISCLEKANWPDDIKAEKEKKLLAFKKAIINLAKVTDIGTHYNDRVATTAFICLNLSSSLLVQKDKEIQDLILNARRWLFHKQKRNKFWSISHPEKRRAVKSNEYYTSVALRGIISTFKFENYDISAIIWCKISEIYKKKIKTPRAIAGFLGLIFIIYFGYEFITNIKSTQILNIIGYIIGFLLGLLGAYPTIKSICSFLKEKF